MPIDHADEREEKRQHTTTVDDDNKYYTTVTIHPREWWRKTIVWIDGRIQKEKLGTRNLAYSNGRHEMKWRVEWCHMAMETTNGINNKNSAIIITIIIIIIVIIVVPNRILVRCNKNEKNDTDPRRSDQTTINDTTTTTTIPIYTISDEDEQRPWRWQSIMHTERNRNGERANESINQSTINQRVSYRSFLIICCLYYFSKL